MNAGENLTVKAKDKTSVVQTTTAGAGAGAAGVAGSLGVVLVHDSAEAFIAGGAAVNAKKTMSVDADTEENILTIGITAGGAAAAGVTASVTVNVVSSDTAAYIGAADVNKNPNYETPDQSVAVNASSATNIINVAASGSGAGAAAVGGVLNTNVLTKNTQAFVAQGADVHAENTVEIAADSSENIISAAVSIRGAGAAAVGAVASVNVIANTTEAFVGGALVDSDGNVRISAVDDTLVVSVAARKSVV